MSIYDKLANRYGLAPLEAKVPVTADGVDFDQRQNFVTLSNAVELVSEVILDIAKRTDGISLDMQGSRLRTNEVVSSVTRSLEKAILNELGKGA